MVYPVEEVVPELKLRLKDNKAVILQAPPGAGKSTIVPLAILNEPWLKGKKIVMLQPRRLAARSVAARIADLLKEKIGETIGYRIRFENVVGKNTRIEVVTEGILTRMLQNDNSLEGVGLVIFDEFHERSLHADLALALCLQSQQLLRDDLRILIMSATLDGEKISSAINNAPIINSLGKQFPVDVKYEAPPKDEHIAVSASRSIKKALKERMGDILVFLPGAGEIRRTQEILETDNVNATIFPLYGEMPFQKQQEALTPNSQLRKVVLATSIAETSLTIEGITTVIDSGYSRVPKFDPRSGLTKLETVKVTRDAADQRLGRAGRLGPGVCYRLWAQATHQHLQPARQPEILEADLAPMMLELFSWGSNVNELNWITPPPTGAVNQATELLDELGAIEKNKITSRGKEMLRLPTHPRIAHMLLSANSDREKSLAIDIASLIEERDPLPRENGADLSLRIELLRKWRSGEKVNADRNLFERIEKNASAWRKIFNLKIDNSIFSDTDVGKLLIEAYPERIAKQTEKFSSRFKLANGRMGKLQDHDSLLQKPWLAIAAMDMGVNEGKIFSAVAVDEDDLIKHAKEKESMVWDKERGMIAASLEKRIGVLILSARQIKEVDESLRIKTLCDALREEGLKLLGWDEIQQQWQARVMSLRQWRKDESWPDVSDQTLLKTADIWLAPYLLQVNKRADFQRLDLNAIVTSILPWELQQQFNKLTPTRLEVPSGSMISLEYSDDGSAPIMKVRLQEVFGMLETPSVNEGRTKIILHLLSPGYKPVQVTQDLKSFWQTTYHEVRKELRMRYPKHHWPEDPWTAQAVRGIKRKT
ncbi:MAG TPA: ATP-dependent helicase HrpB [Cyclobacteriaceae bacterium]|jgi:ATP-dependent helicase HrpB|nr:ATP-dependent helicase HrpB [Cyclobacteriaceae bacterium]